MRLVRDERGLTQRQVAELIGVTHADVSRWERGTVEPGGKYRQLIAEHLFDGSLAAMYAEPEELAAA